MNERIRELAQATDIWCDQNYSGDEFYHLRWEEKFAEMIMQDAFQHLTNIGQDYAREQLERYFGVKE